MDENIIDLTTTLTKKPAQDWRIEDFETEEPYEWIYRQKDNKFLMQQTLTRLEKIAKELGFRDFKAYWRAYVESKTPKVTILGDYDTAFPGQEIQLKAGKYMCDELGVEYINENGSPVEVISHPLMPVARVYDIDAQTEQLELAFTRDNEHWTTITKPKEIVYSAQKIVSLAGSGMLVNSENAREIVKYLCVLESLNNQSLPLIRKTSKLGWHGKAFVPFDTNLKYLDNGDHSQTVGSIHEHGDFCIWLETVKQIRNGEPHYLPARMAMAASFASPLLSLLGKLCFWCNLRSSISSSGKSVAIMLAASIWGDPTIGTGLPRSAKSTTNALELQADTLNNIPLFLDELQTMQNAKGFAETAYNLCEGSGKARAGRDVRLRKPTSWCLTTISSGEMSVGTERDREGALARVVEVVVKEHIFPDPVSLADTIRENYGFAGKSFITGIINEDIAALKAEVASTRKLLIDDGIQVKQADAASMILLADRLAEKHVFLDGVVLSVEDVKTYLLKRDDLDLNRRVYEYVCGWCEQYRANFEDYRAYSGPQYFGKYVDENHYRILKKPLQDELLRNGFDYKSFVDWAVNNKVMDDARGRQARHDGSNGVRLLDFYIKDMDELPSGEKPKKAEPEETKPEPEPEKPKPDKLTTYQELVAADVPDLPFQ